MRFSGVCPLGQRVGFLRNIVIGIIVLGGDGLGGHVVENQYAAALSKPPALPRDLKAVLPNAPKILFDNVHGWFARVERGASSLSTNGRAALSQWGKQLPAQSLMYMRLRGVRKIAINSIDLMRRCGIWYRAQATINKHGTSAFVSRRILTLAAALVGPINGLANHVAKLIDRRQKTARADQHEPLKSDLDESRHVMESGQPNRIYFGNKT